MNKFFFKRIVTLTLVLLSLQIGCGRFSNSFDNNRLECGEGYRAGKTYFTVRDSTGRQLTQKEFLVTHREKAIETPEIYTQVTKNGCVVKPIEGSLFISSMDGLSASIWSADNSKETNFLSLTDLKTDGFRFTCSTSESKRVSSNFYLGDIIEQDLPTTLLQGFEVRYKIEAEDQTLEPTKKLSIGEISDAWQPFRTIKHDGNFKLEIELINLFDKTRNILRKCSFELDSKPSEVEVARNGKLVEEKFEINGNSNFLQINQQDTLTFKEVRTSDLKEIRYCADPLDDDFDLFEKSPKNQEKAAIWQQTIASTICKSDKWITASSDTPINFAYPYPNRGLWSLKYQAIDTLGNQGLIYVQPIFFYQDALVSNIEMAYQTVSGVLVEQSKPSERTWMSITKALEAEVARRSLTTRFEKEKVFYWVLNALLKAYNIEYLPQKFYLADTDLIESFAVSPDRKKMAYRRATNNHWKWKFPYIDILDLSNGQNIDKFDWPLECKANHFSLSHDSKLLLIPCGDHIDVWDIEKHKKISTLKIFQNISTAEGITTSVTNFPAFDFVISPDSKQVAVVSAEEGLQIMDIEKASIIKKLTTSNLDLDFNKSFFRWSSDTGKLSLWTDKLVVWDSKNWEEVLIESDFLKKGVLDLSSDGNLIAYIDNSVLMIYSHSLKKNLPFNVRIPAEKKLQSVKFSTDQKSVIVSQSDAIKVYKVEIPSDNDSNFSTWSDNLVREYPIKSDIDVKLYEGKIFEPMKSIVTIDSRSVTVWKPLKKFFKKGLSKEISSTNSKPVVLTDEKLINQWGFPFTNPFADQISAEISNLSLNKDGNLAVSTYKNGDIKIWDLRMLGLRGFYKDLGLDSDDRDGPDLSKNGTQIIYKSNSGYKLVDLQLGSSQRLKIPTEDWRGPKFINETGKYSVLYTAHLGIFDPNSSEKSVYMNFINEHYDKYCYNNDGTKLYAFTVSGSHIITLNDSSFMDETFPEIETYDACWVSFDGSKVYTLYDEILHVRSSKNLKTQKQIEVKNTRGFVSNVDDRILAAINTFSHHLEIWDSHTREKLIEFEDIDDIPNTVSNDRVLAKLTFGPQRTKLFIADPKTEELYVHDFSPEKIASMICSQLSSSIHNDTSSKVLELCQELSNIPNPKSVL